MGGFVVVKSITRFLALILIVSLGFLLTVGCRGAEEEALKPVQIGTILAFTGDLASFGPPMRNGADLAAELVNAAGGVLDRPVRAVHKDSGTNPQDRKSVV